MPEEPPTLCDGVHTFIMPHEHMINSDPHVILSLEEGVTLTPVSAPHPVSVGWLFRMHITNPTPDQ